MDAGEPLAPGVELGPQLRQPIGMRPGERAERGFVASASGTQEPFLLDLERTGPFLIAGAVRTGRSSPLRTLAGALAGTASPADLHLYGLDCGNHALAPWMTCRTAVPWSMAPTEARTERLLNAQHRGQPAPAPVGQRRSWFARRAAGGHGNG